MRGRIGIARGDLDGALADAKAGLALAREAEDPQVLYPVLGFCAWALCAAGRAAEAAQLADELVGRWRASGRRLPRASSVELAYALADLRRPEALLDALADAHTETPWLEGATAYLAGDFERAADIYGRIGTFPDEAYARLRAAAALVEQNRRREADEQLGRALSFFRSVDATRYIREGEALLAASA